MLSLYPCFPRTRACSLVSDVRRDLVLQHYVMAPAHCVWACHPPLGALPLFVRLEVSCWELYAAGRAAGGAAGALGALVTFHPVAAIAVCAAAVTALYPVKPHGRIYQS